MTYPLHKSIHLLFFLQYRKSFKVHKLTKENGLYSIIPTSINLYTNFIFALT